MACNQSVYPPLYVPFYPSVRPAGGRAGGRASGQAGGRARGASTLINTRRRGVLRSRSSDVADTAARVFAAFVVADRLKFCANSQSSGRAGERADGQTGGLADGRSERRTDPPSTGHIAFHPLVIDLRRAGGRADGGSERTGGRTVTPTAPTTSLCLIKSPGCEVHTFSRVSVDGRWTVRRIWKKYYN